MWKHPSCHQQVDTVNLLHLLEQRHLFWFITWFNLIYLHQKVLKMHKHFLLHHDFSFKYLGDKCPQTKCSEWSPRSWVGCLQHWQSRPRMSNFFSYKFRFKQSPQPKQKVTCLVRETLLVSLWKPFPLTHTSRTFSSPADMHPVSHAAIRTRHTHQCMHTKPERGRVRGSPGQ